MKIRILLPLLAFAISAVACGGGNDSGGGTGGAGTGPTGSSGSATIARFTALAQDTESGITVSFSGVSCEGPGGPYDITIAAQGNATGQTNTTLELTNGKGTIDWSMDVAGAAAGTLSGKYGMELGQTSSVFLVNGVSTVTSGADVRSFPVKISNVPISVGTGACPNP